MAEDKDHKSAKTDAAAKAADAKPAVQVKSVAKASSGAKLDEQQADGTPQKPAPLGHGQPNAPTDVRSRIDGGDKGDGARDDGGE